MILAEGDLEGALMTLCNPLIDMTAIVDQEFLDKWQLKANDAILAEEIHNGLCEDVKSNYEVSYGASGSGQNTSRAAQVKLNTIFMLNILVVAAEVDYRVHRMHWQR